MDLHDLDLKLAAYTLTSFPNCDRPSNTAILSSQIKKNNAVSNNSQTEK